MQLWREPEKINLNTTTTLRLVASSSLVQPRITRNLP
jgi:hypothetical protein